MKVSSTEFQQNVGRYQDVAMREPVTITKNGRNHTVLVSADFFETVMKGRVASRSRTSMKRPSRPSRKPRFLPGMRTSMTS